MRPDSAHNGSQALRWTLVVGIAIAAGAWLVVGLLYCITTTVSSRNRPPVSSPFQLSACTSVEIRYLPHALEYLFPIERERTILSPAETEYLQSAQPLMIKDEQWIRALADGLARPMRTGTRAYAVRESPTIRDVAKVTCRHDSQMLTSFVVVKDTSTSSLETCIVRDEDGSGLWYKQWDVDNLLVVPKMRTYALRKACADNLSAVWHALRPSVQDGNLAPALDHWCDAMTEDDKRMTAQLFAVYHSANWTRSVLTCPGAKEGKCHYAVNPLCTSASPADTVFLFESRPGWNQCGGPELFTDDNHDPAGGCILLKDGTTQFIRSEEELRQLRWQ